MSLDENRCDYCGGEMDLWFVDLIAMAFTDEGCVFKGERACICRHCWAAVRRALEERREGEVE